MVKIALGLPLVAICLAHLWLVGCCVSLPVLVTGEASIGDEDSGGKDPAQDLLRYAFAPYDALLAAGFVSGEGHTAY